jgi:hypothetical protein
MRPFRLLAFLVLIGVIPSFAQNPAAAAPLNSRSADQQVATVLTADAKPAPILNLTPEDTDSFVIAPSGSYAGGTTCYKIRSYVVARDSKHSDSTHPVGYSTCQPARRYGLRKVEIEPRDSNH